MSGVRVLSLQSISEPLASFEGADAYIYDVKWCVCFF